MIKGVFTDRAHICSEFQIDDFDGTVIYADYEYANYEGDAAVVFADKGKLWLVTGSHCSCYGLENNWSPEEVTIDMLRTMAEHHYGKAKEAAQFTVAAVDKLGTHDADALAAGVQLVGEDLLA